jgi:hypothetical protein
MNVERCLAIIAGGKHRRMGRYSCPFCNEDVPPVGLDRSNGRIIPRADGLLVERKVCPRCDARLERSPLHRWHRTGALAAALQPPPHQPVR